MKKVVSHSGSFCSLLENRKVDMKNYFKNSPLHIQVFFGNFIINAGISLNSSSKFQGVNGFSIYDAEKKDLLLNL